MTEQKMQQLSPSTIVARSNGFIDAEIDNEIVALNIDKGACYGLNSVGSRVWTLIASPISVTDICTKLLTEYEVEPRTCERQVLDLLEELRAEGMIAVHEDK
jgi:hypothetical protein